MISNGELDAIVLDVVNYAIDTWGDKIAIKPTKADLRETLLNDEESWTVEIKAKHD